ncbi:MAG: hypothetical protein ACJ72H_16135 [Candidatus Sulfotelmatobacter sp.]
MRQETYTGDPAVLSCWKDIAKYLGKGVRTVQRWEREFELPVRRPRGASRKSAVAAHPGDLDAWMTSRWALRAAKETAQPLERAAELVGLKTAINERIHAARALREQQSQLIHELSAAMQMLVQNCDLLSRGGTLSGPQVRESSRSTAKDYSGLGAELVSLPAFIETQRQSSEEHRRLMRAADAI